MGGHAGLCVKVLIHVNKVQSSGYGEIRVDMSCRLLVDEAGH